MPTDIFKVNATFHDADDNPLAGSDYEVRLFDEDRYFDDKLGASQLSPDGVAEFLITTADIVSVDSPGERTPDIYFVVMRNGREIFRSQVIPDVNFDTKDPVTGRPDGLTKSFGPYRVDET